MQVVQAARNTWHVWIHVHTRVCKQCDTNTRTLTALNSPAHDRHGSDTSLVFMSPRMRVPLGPEVSAPGQPPPIPRELELSPD